jgi:glycolate oxidase iron-sulfur subunit
MTTPSKISAASLFSGFDAPDESDLYKCVHCGFCLQACPTYVETGLETESPRGRIALMKAVNEARINITPAVIRHWDLCIQCRACETVCPSGVPYGRLIEATMAQIKPLRKSSIISKLMSSLSLKYILVHQKRLTLLVGILRIYQRSGLQKALRKSSLLKLISPKLDELEQSLPFVPSPFFKATGQVTSSEGKSRARVALLSGCIMPLIHGPQMEALVRVLTRNNCEVVIPKEQKCCGAINTHVGDLNTARTLARRNIDIFLESNADVIVIGSAGCGSRMKEYDHLLKDDVEYAEKAKTFSKMVKDIHLFLFELPLVVPKARLNYKITYQDSCHLSNGQKITNQPRELLKSIPGVQFIELSNASMCCGAGGTYTITEREFSLKVLETKMNAIKDSGAEIIATANPGCVLQLQYGAKNRNLPIKIRYVTDLLDEAYRLESQS